MIYCLHQLPNCTLLNKANIPYTIHLAAIQVQESATKISTTGIQICDSLGKRFLIFALASSYMRRQEALTSRFCQIGDYISYNRHGEGLWNNGVLTPAQPLGISSKQHRIRRGKGREKEESKSRIDRYPWLDRGYGTKPLTRSTNFREQSVIELGGTRPATKGVNIIVPTLWRSRGAYASPAVLGGIVKIRKLFLPVLC